MTGQDGDTRMVVGLRADGGETMPRAWFDDSPPGSVASRTVPLTAER
jgi:hypothetical protein